MSESSVKVNPGDKANAIDIILDRIGLKDWPIYKLAFGDYGTATQVSSANPLPVSPNTQKTAFDELVTAKLSPVIQEAFQYNINPEVWEKRLNNGTAVVDSHRLSLSTGSGVNRSSALLSKKPLKYSPGIGGLVRFSGIFSTGVVGSTQLIGIGDIADGFLFGYLDADFGVFRIAYGHPEFQTLTVTVASTTAENVIVTIDGNAVNVPVTNSANATITANEISAFDYSNVGLGWETHTMGNIVVFESYRTSATTGAFTLSGTTATGTFVQTLASIVPTIDFIKQTDWNRNKMTNLITTNGNVYQIRYQWLGYGAIRFYIEDETTGKFVLVHVIEYTNKNTLPSINNPTLPLIYFVENTTNATDINIKSASIAGFAEGEIIQSGVVHGVESQVITVPGATETPLLTLHSQVLYQGIPNRVLLKINLIQVVVDGTKTAIVRVYRNPTLVDASFSNVDINSSTALFDISATALSGGNLLFSTVILKNGKLDLNLTSNDVDLRPSEFLTITVESANSTDAVVSINYKDEF